MTNCELVSHEGWAAGVRGDMFCSECLVLAMELTEDRVAHCRCRRPGATRCRINIDWLPRILLDECTRKHLEHGHGMASDSARRGRGRSTIYVKLQVHGITLPRT